MVSFYFNFLMYGVTLGYRILWRCKMKSVDKDFAKQAKKPSSKVLKALVEITISFGVIVALAVFVSEFSDRELIAIILIFVVFKLGALS